MLKSRNSGKFNMVFKFKAKYGYFKEENIIRFKEILQERYPEKSAFEK